MGGRPNPRRWGQGLATGLIGLSKGCWPGRRGRRLLRCSRRPRPPGCRRWPCRHSRCPAGCGLFIRRGLFIYGALAGRCQAWLGTPGCRREVPKAPRQRATAKVAMRTTPVRQSPRAPTGPHRRQGRTGEGHGVPGADVTPALQDYVRCESSAGPVPSALGGLPATTSGGGGEARGLRCMGPAGL